MCMKCEKKILAFVTIKVYENSAIEIRMSFDNKIISSVIKSK